MTNKNGLHARPSALVANTAREFESKIIFAHGKQRADAASILQLLALYASYNTTVILYIHGPDEIKAAAAMQNLFDTKFKDAY